MKKPQFFIKQQQPMATPVKPESVLHVTRAPRHSLSSVIAITVRSVVDLVRFLLLLTIFFMYAFLHRLVRSRLVPRRFGLMVEPDLVTWYMRVIRFFDKGREGTLSRIDLIELSIRNMRFKKTRSLITIGGMAIGIGTIVFLVSIGYGLQELVIGRIARLDEMKQADVLRQTGSLGKITDKTLSNFSEIPAVENVLPLISVVGRITYNNSVSDVAVYGVTSEYLKQSAIKPVLGTIFDSNATTQAVKKGTHPAVE